jgi:hypothetical protein
VITFATDQTQDLPTYTQNAGWAEITALYDRSRDSRGGDAPGQDFIAYACDEGRLAFAVCDGVSQSFFGDLAAQFLGERLVRWLIATDRPDAERLNAVLSEWTADASALVADKEIRESLPPMVRDALTKKRENGSESMFAAGLIDRPNGAVHLCWMGDMRIRVFDSAGEPVEIPGAAWETRERWSSRMGPKNGSARVAELPLQSAARIVVHSDGVGSYAESLHTLAADDLNGMVHTLRDAPASDDVSVLDIRLDGMSAVPIPAGYAPSAVSVFDTPRPTVRERAATPQIEPNEPTKPVPQVVQQAQQDANAAVASVPARDSARVSYRSAPAIIGAVLVAVVLSIGWVVSWMSR